MFARIARRYDLLNHLLSANTDRRWRWFVGHRLRGELAASDAVVLDVACGTGDLSLAVAQTTRARVTGTDFCRPMLEIAARKCRAAGIRIPLVEGDALSLPFANESFDAVTIGFGLRNLSSVAAGLAEFRRVLKPGGRLAILEFSRPVIPGMRSLFGFYFKHLLPRFGGLVSGSRKAYEYLPDSVSRFPDQRGLAGLMTQAGFEKVEYTNLTGGIAALHLGARRDTAGE